MQRSVMLQHPIPNPPYHELNITGDLLYLYHTKPCILKCTITLKSKFANIVIPPRARLLTKTENSLSFYFMLNLFIKWEQRGITTEYSSTILKIELLKYSTTLSKRVLCSKIKVGNIDGSSNLLKWTRI